MTEAYRYDPAAYRDVFERHLTYLAGFWRNVHRYAERPALRDPLTGRRWTYAELGGDVSRLAAGLAAHGVGRGDVVVFQLYNSPEWALLYLAAQHLGAIGAPINFRFSPGETAFVLDDSRPAAYVYDAAIAGIARRPVPGPAPGGRDRHHRLRGPERPERPGRRGARRGPVRLAADRGPSRARAARGCDQL